MRRSIGLLIWMILLAALPAALYGWYFLSQRQLIASLNQRELGGAAENLRGILNIAKINVQNTAREPKFSCRLVDRQIYLTMPEDAKCADYQTDEFIGEFNKDSNKKAKPTLSADRKGILVNVGKLSFKIDLEKALDELVVGDEFEYLLVATESGDIIFQTRRGERKHWIDNLRWTERHNRDDSVRPGSPLRFDNISELVPRIDNKPAFQPQIKTTNSLNVHVAGDDYRLYLQPLLAEIGPDGSQGLVLGGLVNAQTSLNDALSVDPQFALTLAILAGVTVIGWPVLKIILLAPGERFKFVDSYLLLLSGSALLGVSCVVLLQLDNSRRVTDDGTKRLRSLANELASDLKDELASAAGQVSKYDEQLANSREKLNCNTQSQWTRFLEGCTRDRLTKAEALYQPPRIYKQPAAVFWVRGSDGGQFAKATALAQNTPFVSVFSRPYFKAALQDQLWALAPDPEHKYFGQHFFVQTYRSNTTGEFETGFSFPSKVVCALNPTEEALHPTTKNVAVLTTKLVSLSPRALPPDYGFLLIDRTGRVLYHSDPRRSLREDIFEEISEPARLRAILAADHETHLTARYRTGPHEMFVRPFRELMVARNDQGQNESAGWSLITFRDLQFTHTARGEAGVSALAWFSIYFVAVQLAPALLFIAVAPGRHKWMWPDKQKLHLYAALALTLASLAGAGVLGIALADDWALSALSSVVGAIGTALAFFAYRRWDRSPNANWYVPSSVVKLLSVAQWRAVSVALLLTVASVIPAAGFFKLSWNQEFGSLLAAEARHSAQRTVDLTSAIQERMRTQFASVYPEKWHDLVKEFIDWETRLVVSKTFPMDGVDNAGHLDPLADWKPIYNEAAAALRYQKATPEAMLARWCLSMRPGLFVLFGGSLLAAGLFNLIFRWDRRLLLSDIDVPVPSLTAMLAQVDAGRQNGRDLFVLTTSEAQREQVRYAIGRQLAAAAAATGAASPQPAAAVSAVIDFSDDLRTPESRAGALSLLKRTPGGHGNVVLARIDPIAVLFGERFATVLDDSERRQWSDVLERFSFILLPPQLAPEDNKDTDLSGPAIGSEQYYRSLWESCSEAEKLVLVHVAEEGFVNPRMIGTTERLLRRGLLVKDPDLRPFSPDFGRFIRRAYDRSVLLRWEHLGRGWNQARWVVAFLVIAISLFLLSTQRQALTPVFTFVSAAIGTLAGILKLVADLSPKKGTTTG